jgi:hypothetical protein
VLAGKGQQLPRHAGRAFGGVHDLLETMSRCCGKSILFERELTVPEDDREHVVEVMRDASGETPHGLHALRVCELEFELFARLFGLLLRRDLCRDRPDADHEPFGISQRKEGELRMPRTRPRGIGVSSLEVGQPFACIEDMLQQGIHPARAFPQQLFRRLADVLLRGQAIELA